MSSRTKSLVAGLIVVLSAIVFGYYGYYGMQKQRDLRGAMRVMLQETAPHMREALTLEVSLPPAGRMGTADQLERHADAVDHRLQQLKSMDGSPDRAVADATDSYLVTVREILRKQSAANRARQSLSDSLEALRKHMQADDRTGAWVEQAVAAKERADKDYRDYRISAEAFNTVLGTLSDAQTRIAAHVEAQLLCDVELIKAVRDQTVAALSETAGEMAKIRLPGR